MLESNIVPTLLADFKNSDRRIRRPLLDAVAELAKHSEFLDLWQILWSHFWEIEDSRAKLLDYNIATTLTAKHHEGGRGVDLSILGAIAELAKHGMF